MSSAIIVVFILFFGFVSGANVTQDECGQDLHTLHGLTKLRDVEFMKRVLKSLAPSQHPQARMQFYLYKREFPTCGREMKIDYDSLHNSGFNASHPTRIIIHGWMSQSKSSFNRGIKDAYLSLGDYNVIITDWHVTASTLNYYKVAKLIESFGEIVANFTKYLHQSVDMSFDDVYLIGHSLGAQIAGSAGKLIQPDKFNTIFALDPAGPAFRDKDVEQRIDSSDAKYVESIQTSSNFGFLEPVGNATFYPNMGTYQKCVGLGCSHRRAHKFFVESITSARGFWGTACEKKTPADSEWHCPKVGQQYKMGGEPSTPKVGVFYVKTNRSPPYAKGKDMKYVYA